MTRAPATIKQADVARTLRAAKKAGASCVDVMVNGTTVRIHLDDPTRETTTIAPEPLPFDKWKAGKNAR